MGREAGAQEGLRRKAKGKRKKTGVRSQESEEQRRKGARIGLGGEDWGLGRIPAEGRPGD